MAMALGANKCEQSDLRLHDLTVVHTLVCRDKGECGTNTTELYYWQSSRSRALLDDGLEPIYGPGFPQPVI